MAISGTSDVVLLLTAHLSSTNDSGAKPLTTKEWWLFVNWLEKRNATPECLLENVDEVLRSISAPKKERIKRLLDRGAALGLAKDRWKQAGLWWLTSADEDYPSRLKKRLGQASPAVLYGCGHRTLLCSMNYRAIAVVGSRAASDRDLSWAQLFGEAVADAGYSVVSGGAKGIDRAAMFGALDKKGTVVGILADSLIRASSSKMYRSHLRSQDLVLISPFHPEAGFTVGRAMQRNQYIYCLSDKALVVHSDIKGGTWEGAIENMKKQWVPIWVRQDSNDSPGNAALLSVHHAQGPPQEVIQQICASDQSVASSGQVENEPLYAATEVAAAPSAGNVSEQPEDTSQQPPPSGSSGLYEHFRQDLCKQLDNKPVQKSELESHYRRTDGLTKTQFNDWIKKAVEQKVVTESKMLSLNQQPPQLSGSSGLYEHFRQDLCKQLDNKPVQKSELESHYRLVKTQFNDWIKKAIEQKVVTESKMLSLNQQPPPPSGSSGLYEHFQQDLCKQLDNKPVQKSELESHYRLVKTQFNIWIKKAIEQKVVIVTKSNPKMLSLNQQPELIT